MKVLFLGDIVGPAGVTFLQRALPALVANAGIDLVIANAENASNGTGLTPGVYKQLRAAGVDLVTLGDHVYKKLDVTKAMEKTDRICRPANYPDVAPGRDFAVVVARDG